VSPRRKRFYEGLLILFIILLLTCASTRYSGCPHLLNAYQP